MSAGTINTERLLTVRDITALLQVKKSYVYYLTHNRKIPHFKIHGHLRFRLSEIEDWLKIWRVCEDAGIQEEFQERT